jgi:hypothetical protein
MCPSFSANLFELRKYKPLKVNIYLPDVTPTPEKPAQFYQIIGRLARNLTKSMQTAVISEKGRIMALEALISKTNLMSKIELEDIGIFNVKLTLESTESIGFADSPSSYSRLVSKIVDLALVHLSTDYYKYSELSPYIMERGEGYFDESLRKRIGIEDGRRFYRGLRVVENAPYLVINREIELRSWKNLLNELKILAEWWQASRKRGKEVDFYDPPKEFIRFVNWAFRNRTANVKRYPSPPIVIKELTWDVRAKDKVLGGTMSPVEYHRKTQGVKIEDENQPLVKWSLIGKDGSVKDQFHVPELLVVGHTFKDISMRVSKAQISQVFDVLHPHCGDQQRKIFDVVRKVDNILRRNFPAIYPSKIEFSTIPKDISGSVIPSTPIELRFGNKEISITPPYGVNFYHKFSKTTKFAKPITGNINVLMVAPKDFPHSFMEILSKEIESRNNCKLIIFYATEGELSSLELSKYNLAITISNDGDKIRQFKETFIGNVGIAHQNITPEKAMADSVPQLVMQITLKLGGRPWLIQNPEKIDILAIYSYRNPFSGSKMYLFNFLTPEGDIVFQSEPFLHDDLPTFLDELGKKAREYERLLIMMSFADPEFRESILGKVASKVNEFVLIHVKVGNELRLFSTFRPVAVPTRRRRTPTTVYPVEAYEEAPQGIIFAANSDEFYIVTTSSKKLGTYHRGCPTPIRVKILASKGSFKSEKILHCILSLSAAAGTSGHETRLPSPLYYLRKYAAFVNAYDFKVNKRIAQEPYYV